MSSAVGTTTDPRSVRFGALRRVHLRDWIRVGLWAGAAALLIAIPARLVPNDLFRRMTPTRPQDYVFWVAGSLLVGLVLGLRHADGGRQDAKAVTGGFGTFLAVGCPVCNKIVVALLGVGGATSVFAPFQPVLGVASLALLGWALRARLRALTASDCPVPAIGAART